MRSARCWDLPCIAGLRSQIAGTSGRPLGKYAITLMVTFAVNLAILDLLVVRARLSPLAAQAVAMAIATAATYRMQTQWVFRSHEVIEETDESAKLLSASRPAIQRRRAA